MKKYLRSLVRQNILDLVPYSSARDEYKGDSAQFMDANENPYNAPYNRYPDPEARRLKERISRIKNVPAEQLFLGNGSDEAIDLIYRVFCEPGKDQAIAISPSYGMYKVCADIHNVDLINVSLDPDFSLNKERILAACTPASKLLFICSPNNPTSNSFDPEIILSLVKELDMIVVVDEAYIDFSTRESLANYVADLANLLILQTFSKAWGLAGIRLGIAIGNPIVIDYMNRVKYPYNLNMLTQNFALEALQDTAQKDAWVSSILKSRKNLERQLKRFRFVEKVYPSDANFLLVAVRRALKVYNFLVANKIVVRDRSRVELCEACLRITVGTEEENKALIDALMQYQRDFVNSCEI